MYNCICSIDKNFPHKQIKELFYKNKDVLEIVVDYNDFIKNHTPLIFACFVENDLIGFIYFHEFEKVNNKYKFCYISGCAKRGKHNDVVYILNTMTKYIINYYKLEYILAKTYFKTAKMALLNAGYKKIENNLLKYINTERKK